MLSVTYTIVELLNFAIFVICSIFFVKILFYFRFVDIFLYSIAKILNAFV